MTIEYFGDPKAIHPSGVTIREHELLHAQLTRTIYSEAFLNLLARTNDFRFYVDLDATEVANGLNPQTRINIEVQRMMDFTRQASDWINERGLDVTRNVAFPVYRPAF